MKTDQEEVQTSLFDSDNKKGHSVNIISYT
jgi:hypothetical protein